MGLGGTSGNSWSDWRSRARRASARQTNQTNSNANRGPQRQTAANLEYYRPGGAAAQNRDLWMQNVPQQQRTREGFQSFMSAYGTPTPGVQPPLAPSGPGGGSGWGGGGGGGGGAPAMTQAMFDAMLQALGTRGPQLTLQQTRLPAFRGTNVPAFNAQPYNEMSQNLNQAVAADQAAITAGANQTTEALGAYNANPYAGAQAAPPPAADAQGAALQATAGGVPGGAGDANAAAANQASAGAGAETAAFNDLLKVLGANYGAAQNSRMGEVQMTAQSARNQLGAQNRGLSGQIGMARTGAMEQWRQQDAERRNQNSMMSQQWSREGLMRNQDIANQQRQGNWQQGNEMIQNRLTPLLQLIQGTQGSTVNMSALQQMLRGWSR